MIVYGRLFFLMLIVRGPRGFLRRAMTGSQKQSVEARLLCMQRLQQLLLIVGWAIAANHGL